MSKLKIIECPRDAMQSIKKFIPTDKKIRYIQSLLNVGFDTVDMGSFVSKKVIPQLYDTGEVINSLDIKNTQSKLLVIVANIKGAKIASDYEKISCVGFPFSISENFQMRNTNRTIDESFNNLLIVKEIVENSGKELVVYLSMCFGNPYGDIWSLNIIDQWVSKLIDSGIRLISLSDTIGSANPKLINEVFTFFSVKYPYVEFGLHLHTNPNKWKEKVDASLNSGCIRLDGAIQGYGGCPMATDSLVGNMPTEKLISYCEEKKIDSGIKPLSFETAYNYASDIFINFQ